MEKFELNIKIEADLETIKAILNLLDKKNIEKEKIKFVNKGPRY